MLRTVIESLADLDERAPAGPVDADATRVTQLELLERIKAAASAAQARIATGFATSQLAAQRDAGVQAPSLGRGIGEQVALACRVPSSQGSRRLGFARAVVSEMPHTHALLTGGDIDEWTATLLVRETACLTREDRAAVDERLCATRVDEAGRLIDPPVLAMTPRRVANAARAIAAELDVAAVVRRAEYARAERRVWARPAPDGMAWLTALLPMPQAVACLAGLRRAATQTSARPGGDPRTGAQIMADILVQRVTGQATADAVPVEIQLVMTPETLIGASPRAARFGDGSPLPAAVARDVALAPSAPRWLRRIFTDPATGVVTGVDRRRRRFTPAQGRVIAARDQHCRLPGCDAVIVHYDHIERYADGGDTVVGNGQGLCAAHNQLKETAGWHCRVMTTDGVGQHVVEITTPTGHTYRSHAPPALPP